MSGLARDQREGLTLIVGIVVGLGVTLFGYRWVHEEMLVFGIISMVLPGAWVIVRPRHDGDPGTPPDHFTFSGDCGDGDG